MKKYYLNSPQQPDVSNMDPLFAEMLLDKVLRDFQIKRIQKEIDQSLEDRNEKDFLRLTEELKVYLE